MANRWRVRKEDDRWFIYDRHICHDSCDTLQDAHTYATQMAVADVLFNPGGLTILKTYKERNKIQQAAHLK